MADLELAAVTPAYRPPAPAGSVEAPTRILLVEDNPEDAAVIGDYFDEAPLTTSGVEIECVSRLGEALARLAEGAHDVVLLDLSLPDAFGLEGLAAVTGQFPHLPVVVMTGLADERVALEAMKVGAQDYLSKGVDGPRVVRRAVRYAIERHRLQHGLTELLGRERTARAAAEQAARARDEMLGIVSHDLRNPLSAISMSAAALAEGAPADVRKLAHTILRSSDWALRIIRDLVDVTAMEAGHLTLHPEPMTVQAIAERVLSVFSAAAAAAGVRFGVEVQDAPHWITVDVDRILQAVGNLLGNAIKFTPRDGAVALRITGGPDATVHFSVTDSGPGIPAEHLPHVFDRFWQGRKSLQGGAGLGLFIADGIAAAHGGRIEVRSMPDSGSCFTLVVPVGRS